MSDAFLHCQEQVRAHDPERFAAALFADPAHRPALMALYAFHLELVRVREVVRDPMPGEIRLQWWRDLLQGIGHGDVHGHPVADALLQTVEHYRLPRAPLVAMTEARVFDLYDDPMPDLGTFEGYAGETHGALFQIAALVLADGADPGTGTLAGHAGVAEAIVAVIRALPHHLARAQVYLPGDVLERHGTTPSGILSNRDDPGLKAVVGELAAHATHHLERASEAGATVPARVAPAFLTLSLVPPALAKIRAAGYEPWSSDPTPPRMATLWRLWRAARRMRAAGKSGSVPISTVTRI
ncbi:phytoene/squalene synthase family protein [Amorphus sp. 3PC139-8]|uniref:phytoene/squalene synthase family protein n=1 Tax=Amorphus sp. 3PC139-8 TaxID=2735676 RepID=UPI00345DA3B5